MVFSIEMMFCVRSSSHGLIFVYIREPQMDIQCTQEFSKYSVVYTRVQNALLCDLSPDFFCVHKSTYWNVVNARVHQQLYYVSCGGISNLIWIFSLHLKSVKSVLKNFEKVKQAGIKCVENLCSRILQN